MNYTSGEWKIKQVSGENPAIVSDSKIACIARVEVDNYDVAGNAQLIAAAPDLYKALRAIYMHVPPTNAEWDNAAKAIAKAEGK